MIVPPNTNGRWSRNCCDSHGNLHVITTLNGVNIKTKVVMTQPVRNGKGQPITSPKAIRRALAHHYAGYRGKLVCKLHEGESSDCRFCIRGIPKHVCGDCNEPLPACRCMRNDPWKIVRGTGTTAT